MPLYQVLGLSILMWISLLLLYCPSLENFNHDAINRSNVEGALLSRLGGVWHCPLIASAVLGIQFHAYLLLQDRAVKAYMLAVVDM